MHEVGFRRRMVLAALGAGAALIACVDPGAPDRCREVRAQYCAKIGELCPTPSEDECRDLFDDELVCDDAVGTEETIDVCLGDIDRIDACPSALPVTCRGVIWFEPD